MSDRRSKWDKFRRQSNTRKDLTNPQFTALRRSRLEKWRKRHKYALNWKMPAGL